MHSITLVRSLFVAAALGCAAPAQDVASGLAAAQQALDAGEWQRAVELLLPLVDVATEAEREAVAGRLGAASQRLHDAGSDAGARAGWAAAERLLRKIHGASDHADLAKTLDQLGTAVQALGKPAEAQPHFEAALAMARRLWPDADRAETGAALNNFGYCLVVQGRHAEGLPHLEQALAMLQRVHGGRDDMELAVCSNNLGVCLFQSGKPALAQPHFEASVAMRRRLSGDRPTDTTAQAISNLASCLRLQGRLSEALAQYEAALAMLELALGGTDHQGLAIGRNNIASCLRAMGQPARALPLYEAALAMHRRLRGDADHPDVATTLNNVAACLNALGQNERALAAYEESLAMEQRLRGDQPHPNLASTINNIGSCLRSLDRLDAALAQFEAALAMRRRVFGERDHSDVARSLDNVANCLLSLGRPADALAQCEAGLAMYERLFPGRDHPDVAISLRNAALCLQALGRSDDAIARAEAALRMNRALFGERDHPAIAAVLTDLAGCQLAAGRPDAALPHARAAAVMVESLFESSRTLSTGLRQAFFDLLKRGSPFELLQQCNLALDDAGAAFAAAERSRSRALLELLAQAGLDPLAEAHDAAQRRGDDAALRRLETLRGDLEQVQLTVDRLLGELLRLDDPRLDAAASALRRAALLRESDAAFEQRRKLLDQRASAVADVVPTSRALPPDAIQRALEPGELLLEYTIASAQSIVYLLGKDGAVDAIVLPDAPRAIAAHLPALLAGASRQQVTTHRGRPPGEDGGAAVDLRGHARALFAALLPPAAWERVRSCKRVWLAPHRALHRLPFELLDSGTGSEPALWLDCGPPIAYVPSGSVMHWLRGRRPPPRGDDAAGLLAVGDPGAASTDDGAREASAPPAHERLRGLPPLRGALAEAQAIADGFRGAGRRAVLLTGAAATESAVLAATDQPTYLHFACHGIAEEYAGQSLSMLVLAPPAQVTAADDGLLVLDDLLRRWRGRLAASRLVVLSACSTYVGPTFRDESPMALPTGFLFAGASAVVSSVWRVDDTSTRELMTDFYQRLLSDDADPLAALAAAKRELRQRHPDPFHWAPFLYVGRP